MPAVTTVMALPAAPWGEPRISRETALDVRAEHAVVGVGIQANAPLWQCSQRIAELATCARVDCWSKMRSRVS